MKQDTIILAETWFILCIFINMFAIGFSYLIQEYKGTAKEVLKDFYYRSYASIFMAIYNIGSIVFFIYVSIY